MIVRYKGSTEQMSTNKLSPDNPHEVVTVDGTVPVGDLDVNIDGEWRDMAKAFEEKAIVPNYNKTAFSKTA